VKERYDASGGSVDLAADGRNLDLCSGGFEWLHFDWHFDQDVTRLSDGGALSAGLNAGIAGLKEPCTGGIAAISFIAIAGSAGITAPLSDEDLKVMDIDRFFTKAPGEAWAGREPRVGLGNVGVTTRPPVEGRDFAYFFIRIGVRGHSNELRYVYIYQRGDGGGLGGGGEGASACGHSLGSGIYDKWQQLGGESGILGCAASDEAEAGASPHGTTGRYAFFSAGDGGLIVWHRNGPHAGATFEVHGCIFKLYQSLGGTGSWLGFPISDEYDVPGGRRSDFENGYVVWDAQTRICRAFPYVAE
jgi:hypothetical protein